MQRIVLNITYISLTQFLSLFLISKVHLPYLASLSCQGCSLRWKNLRVKFRPDSDSADWKRPRFSFFMWEGGTNLHRIISNSLKNVRFPSLRHTYPKQEKR